MEIMVYFLFGVLQDLSHQPYLDFFGCLVFALARALFQFLSEGILQCTGELM